MNTINTNIALLPLDDLTNAAACLKVMAHPVRLRIVDILSQGDVTVREIAEMCEIKQHQACEHLRLMQNCGLLTSERHGQTVHYKISSPQLPALLECVRQHCGSPITIDHEALEGAQE
jgi:DNA-binding transcriptional ArsR family regulator